MTSNLTPAIWTDRCVRFKPYPRTPDDKWEALFEALPDHYWERPGWVRRWLEPGISSASREISVSGLPWWMPKWWARRTVVKIAMKHGVGGEAVYVVERVSLP
jgi:hypothetical protein